MLVAVASLCASKCIQDYHLGADRSAAEQMERRARLRKIMATMDDEDDRKAALPGIYLGHVLTF